MSDHDEILKIVNELNKSKNELIKGMSVFISESKHVAQKTTKEQGKAEEILKNIKEVEKYESVSIPEIKITAESKVIIRPPGKVPPATPKKSHPSTDPTTDPKTVPPGIVPGTEPSVPVEPASPQIPDEQEIFLDLSPDFNGVRSQGALGACTAFAATSTFEYILSSTNELSPLYQYYKTREIEGTILKDNGASSMNSVVTSLLANGVCFETKWPYNMRKFADAPSEEAYYDAVQKKIAQVHRITKKDPDQWVYALANKHPLIIAIQCPNDLGASILYHNTNPKTSGGHAMIIVGYHSHYPITDKSGKTNGIKAFKVRNSWGQDWCENGYVWITAETLTKILMYDPIIITGQTSEKPNPKHQKDDKKEMEKETQNEKKVVDNNKELIEKVNKKELILKHILGNILPKLIESKDIKKSKEHLKILKSAVKDITSLKNRLTFNYVGDLEKLSDITKLQEELHTTKLKDYICVDLVSDIGLELINEKEKVYKYHLNNSNEKVFDYLLNYEKTLDQLILFASNIRKNLPYNSAQLSNFIETLDESSQTHKKLKIQIKTILDKLKFINNIRKS